MLRTHLTRLLIDILNFCIFFVVLLLLIILSRMRSKPRQTPTYSAQAAIGWRFHPQYTARIGLLKHDWSRFHYDIP
jgi:hypothetical protein